MRGQRFAEIVGAHAAVGVHLFPTLGDRDNAVDQIHTYMKSLVADTEHAAGKPTGTPLSPSDLITAFAHASPAEQAQIMKQRGEAIAAMGRAPLYDFLIHAIYPTWNEWLKFHDDQGAVSQFFTSWDDYTGWFDRMLGMRKQAEVKGVHLTLPEPAKMGTTIWDAPGAVAKPFHDAYDLAKVAAWGAVGLGALFGVAIIYKTATGK